MITRRRLLSLLPLPGIALASSKLLPPETAMSAPSATVHEVSSDRRYLIKLKRTMHPEELDALQQYCKKKKLNFLFLNIGDFDIYELDDPRPPATTAEAIDITNLDSPNIFKEW